MGNKTKHVSMILTETCNLNCIYCYEKNKKNRNMSFDVAQKIINDVLTSDDDFDTIAIEFFGGEPFLQYSLIKDIVNYTLSHSWKKRYYFFATTNGTMITEEIKSFLREYKDIFTCGLSIDGTRRMHNLNRSGSYDMIDIMFFKKLWPNQKVKMTISEKTIGNLAEGVKHLHELGFLVSVNLAYGIDWEYSKYRDIYLNQMYQLVEYYSNNPQVPMCSLLGRNLAVLSGKNNSSAKWCGVGTEMETYDIYGNKYPCQFFVGLSTGKEYNNDIDFSDNENYVDSKCINCFFYPVCPTCYGYNYLTTGKLYKRDKNLCEFAKISILSEAKIEFNRLINKIALVGVSGLSTHEKKKLLAIKKIQEYAVDNLNGGCYI